MQASINKAYKKCFVKRELKSVKSKGGIFTVKEQKWGCTHHNDAGTDEIPTCFPPQPEEKAPFPNHHLNVFNKTVTSCDAWKEHVHVHS